jgi:hypothetical protein
VRLFSQAQSRYLYQANEEMIPVAPRVSA